MNDKVDEAVATALMGVKDHLTGDEVLDGFIQQSFITLGGMVKINALAMDLDISKTNKLLMEMTLRSYTETIQRIVFDMTREDD